MLSGAEWLRKIGWGRLIGAMTLLWLLATLSELLDDVEHADDIARQALASSEEAQGEIEDMKTEISTLKGQVDDLDRKLLMLRLR